jgi:hypothetical protein
VRSREESAELRTPEHLPPGEVEAAKANRYATMILVAFRHGCEPPEPSISSMASSNRPEFDGARSRSHRQACSLPWGRRSGGPAIA